MTSQADYFRTRTELLQHYQTRIIDVERKYMDFLCDITLQSADRIYTEFCQAEELLPFWVEYPPVQRGRAPRGTSIPWGEVGEKTISYNLVRAISLSNPSITHPGLPLGGDVRFATDDAFIHIDIKLTGPNDNPNEVVASPHQISGDGIIWNRGVLNSREIVIGPRATMNFQPELPPFYILGQRVLICLTYFIKVVYTVESLGVQPLDYLEWACVPNGLIMFDGPNYENQQGLLIPGKDDQSITKKRTRVRLEPLVKLHDWRCSKIVKTTTGWQRTQRGTSSTTSFS